MGNRVGVILHNSFSSFSPLFYSHYGADYIPYRLRTYLVEYYSKNPRNTNDGHLYNCKHVMTGFIKALPPNVHERVESLSCDASMEVANDGMYQNCFDGGCYIVDVSTENYGQVVGDGHVKFQRNNIMNAIEEDIDEGD